MFGATRHRNAIVLEKIFSGKYGFVAWKFEIWTSCLGVPIAFRGPIHGKCHDMQFTKDDTAPFAHFEHERFLVDSGYFGMNHGSLPFKAPEGNGKSTLGYATAGEQANQIHLSCMADEDEPQRQLTAIKYWNKIHSHVRSRIERKFSHMMMWKWTKHTDLNADAAHNAMLVTIAVESFTGFKYPPHYETWEAGDPSIYATGKRCKCVPGTKEYRAQYRLCLSERFFDAARLFTLGFAPERRLPQKRGREVPDGESESDDEVEKVKPPHKPFTNLIGPNDEDL